MHEGYKITLIHMCVCVCVALAFATRIHLGYIHPAAHNKVMEVS